MKSIHRTITGILAFVLLMGSYSGVQASIQTAPAAAGAVYYVSQSGSGTACSSTSPCSLSTGMNKLAAGDTLNIQGTLTTSVTISKSGTATSRINITGGKIAAPQSVQDALLVSGSYLSLSNLEVTGGASFGVRVKGHDVTLTNVSVHDSVWENRSGDSCRSDTTTGWGRGLTFAPTTYNIEVSGGSVYNNCGEGVGFTQNQSSYIHGTRLYDNFSRNIYIGNAANVTVENVTSYYSNPSFYRNGKPGRCIGLAIETTNYSTVGNMMHGTLIRGNTLTDCLGINFYAEVANQYPSDVLVENNTFVRVPSPQVDIPGTNITVRNNTILNSDPTPQPAATLTPTAMAPASPTPTSIVNTSTPTTIVYTATPQTPNGTQTSFDDKDSAFTYSNGWKTVKNGSALNGSYHQTSSSGASVAFNFSGTGIGILFRGGSSYGLMDVYVDDVKAGTIDQHRSSPAYNLRWDYPGQLVQGLHTLNLVFVTSSSNTDGSLDGVIVSSGAAVPASATATAMVLLPSPTSASTTVAPSSTSVVLLPSPTPTSTTAAPSSTATAATGTQATYDDTDSGFSYSTGWSTVTSGSAYQGSYRQTSTNGSSTTFHFTGSSFSLIYKGGPSYRLMDVYVDGLRVGTIDQRFDVSTYNARWDYPGQLALGLHTVAFVFVTSSSSTNGSVDALIVR